LKDDKPVCECNPGYIGENCLKPYITIGGYELNGTEWHTFTSIQEAKDFCRENLGECQGINSIKGSASVIRESTKIINSQQGTYVSILPISNGKNIFQGYFVLKGTKIKSIIFKDFNKILPYFQDEKDAEGYTCVTKPDPSHPHNNYVVDFFKNITEMEPSDFVSFASIKWG